jgi:hypothetical protein
MELNVDQSFQLLLKLIFCKEVVDVSRLFPKSKTVNKNKIATAPI